MASPHAKLPGEALRKGPEDADEDYERVVERIGKLDFDDWPNEAGVCVPPLRGSRSLTNLLLTLAPTV